MDPNNSQPVPNQPIEPQSTEPVQPNVATPEIPTTPPVELTLTPTPSQIPVPPKTSSLLMISVIVLVISLIAGGVYFAYQSYFVKKQASPFTSPKPTVEADTPTPNPTANWKTYTNTKYKYSVSYPPSWKPLVPGNNNDLVEPDVNYPNSLNIWQIGLDGTQVGSPVVIGIIIPDGDINQLFDGRKKTETQLNGTQTTKYEKISDNKLSINYIFVMKGNRYLELSISHDINDPIQKTLDQIISTFKFIQ